MALNPDFEPYILWLDVKNVGIVKASEGLRNIPATYDLFNECWIDGMMLLSEYSDILGFKCFLQSVPPL